MEVGSNGMDYQGSLFDNSKKKAKPQRKPCPYWDNFVAVSAINPVISHQASRLGKCVQEAKAGGLKPEDILRFRDEIWIKEWKMDPTAPINPETILKFANQLVKLKPSKPEPTTTDRYKAYIERLKKIEESNLKLYGEPAYGQ